MYACKIKILVKYPVKQFCKVYKVCVVCELVYLGRRKVVVGWNVYVLK